QHHRAALLLLRVARGPALLWVRRPGLTHAPSVVTTGGAPPLPSGEEAAKGGGHLGDLPGVDALLAGVGQVRVAGAVVERRDAERGEPGHVGPAELGPRDAARRGQ